MEWFASDDEDSEFFSGVFGALFALRAVPDAATFSAPSPNAPKQTDASTKRRPKNEAPEDRAQLPALAGSRAH